MDESAFVEIKTTSINSDGTLEPSLKSFKVNEELMPKVREEMLKDWKDNKANYEPVKVEKGNAGLKKVTWTDSKGQTKEFELKANQTFYEFKWGEDKHKEVVEELRNTPATTPAAACNPNVQDKCVDKGCALINDLDKMWQKIGDVFPEYKTADVDAVLALMKSKLPKLTLYWNKVEDALYVGGAKSNIRRTAVTKAFDGMKGITSESNANKIIATILSNKIRKLFG